MAADPSHGAPSSTIGNKRLAPTLKRAAVAAVLAERGRSHPLDLPRAIATRALTTNTPAAARSRSHGLGKLGAQGSRRARTSGAHWRPRAERVSTQTTPSRFKRATSSIRPVASGHSRRTYCSWRCAVARTSLAVPARRRQRRKPRVDIDRLKVIRFFENAGAYLPGRIADQRTGSEVRRQPQFHPHRCLGRG